MGHTGLGENSTNILERVIRQDGNDSNDSNESNRTIVGKPRCLFPRKSKKIYKENTLHLNL